MTQKLYEGFQLVATVDPATLTAGVTAADAVDMSKYERVIAVLAIGNMAAQTVDFGIRADIDGTMDGADVGTVRSVTQLAAHATNNDNDQLIVEVGADELGSYSGTAKRYAQAFVTIGAASPDTGGPCCVMVFGKPRFSDTDDLSTVQEIAG